MILLVKVKPNARRSALTRADDGSWLASLVSPPVNGKANDELVALVARHFACRRADVAIRSGATSRVKRIEIVDRAP